MWIPCWRWNDRTFLKLRPTSSRPGHQRRARALPPLPLRDPVIESAEHGVYFGCTSERSRWREGGRERERQIKDRGRGAGTNHNISFLNRQQSLSSLGLFMPPCCCKTHIQTAGKWPKTFTDIIWSNGIKHSVGLWYCESQLYLFTVVSSI